MRAVIFTDFFQCFIMIATVSFICIKGTHDVGGVANLWRINEQGGRLKMFNFNSDPFIRQNFWSLYIGGIIYFSLNYCFDQQMMQRFIACKSKRKAQLAMVLNIPFLIIFMFACCYIGLVLYANYATCDLISIGYIKSVNHYSSYFVLNNLYVIPGVVGLFLGAVFCSSLSTVSSCLNSLVVVIWEDFLCRIEAFHTSDVNRKLKINKITVAVCGLLSTLLCYAISASNLNLIQLNNTLNGTFNAPLIGLFCLSLFFSITNKYGAVFGALIGLSVNLWLSLGAFVVNPVYPKLSVSVESCYNDSSIYNSTNFIIEFPGKELHGFSKFYSLSYMWYAGFGAVVTILSGLLVSLLTGGLRNKVDKSMIIFDLSKFCKLK
jgi:Na+/proline symporter